MAPDAGASFTERVRQELSRAPLGSRAEARAELAGILHLAGSLHLRGEADDPDRLTIRLTTRSGSVARRAFSLLGELYGLRPVLSVRAPGGVRERSTYGVAVEAGAAEVAQDCHLIDAQGRLLRGSVRAMADTRASAIAVVRGAFLAAGSVSQPGRSPHLEIRAGRRELAEELAGLVRELVSGHAAAVAGEPPRVVAKSGETIGEFLAALGASTAFLDWDEQRLRRSLRSEANRLANADAANLRRTIAAATSQTKAVERVVAALGWEELAEDLRDVALARIANPSASLQELAELCGVSKSAVHRRLHRLEELAESLE
ncbi:MAG: DNA-binding protein WhiA [Nitriliruptorales bacterium]|nr:DNA-binding protein WhiA [Nitriliruptorales bacterium]